MAISRTRRRIILGPVIRAAAGAALLLLAGGRPAAASGSEASPAPPVLIRARILYTAAGAPLIEGWVLVREGKIERVGVDFPVPPGTEVMEAETVMPGMVDMHSHLGLYGMPLIPETMDGNETSSPLTPELRAVDAFDFDDPGIAAAAAGGVTTIVSRPGSANVIGGVSVAVKMKPGARPEDMVLAEICDLKMTIENNPVAFHGAQGRMPATLGAVYWLARRSFLEAREYRDRRQKYRGLRESGGEAAPPPRDPGKDHLVMALDRKIPIHVHVCTASEILSAIRLADEFGLRLSLAHVPGAYQIVDLLARRPDVHYNVGCTTLHTWHGDGLQLKNTAAILARAGLPVSIQADTVGSYQGNQRYLAAMGVRYGMREEDALRAVTINAARGAGLDGRVGSIEPGKDADLVFLDGPPFEMTTSVLQTMVEGRVVYRRPEADRKKYRIPEDPTAEPGSLALPGGLERGIPFALRGARVFPMAGPEFTDAVVLVRDGQIEKVGKNLVTPPGYAEIDVSGRTLIPGLVSARSALGLGPSFRKVVSHNETTRPVFPELEVKHAVEPQSPDFAFARGLGVTTALITPGDRAVLGGLGLALKTVGAVVDRMIVRDRAMMMGGLGVRAKRGNRKPVTRMAEIALLRGALIRAREYGRETEDSRNGRPPDLSARALLPVVRGEIPLMLHVERRSDILAALRLGDEFGLDLILTGAADAWKVIPELSARDVPVILERVYRRSENTEERDFRPDTPARLAAAGVRVAFRAEEGGLFINPAVAWGGGDMLELAALAVESGMDPDAALRAITIEPARMIGLDDRVGSIEPGKDADLLILNGHPLSVRSLPEAVFIDGRLVYKKTEGEHFAAPRPPDLPRRPAPETGPVRRSAKGPGDHPAAPMKGGGDRDVLVIRNGRLFPVTGPVMEKGTVIIRGGRIAALGRDIDIPAGARVIDAAGGSVLPGLFDAFTAAGAFTPGDPVADFDEAASPLAPRLRIIDALDPAAPPPAAALRAGVTSLLCAPGPGNVLSGRSAVIRPYGESAEKMTRLFPAAMHGGLGEIPKRRWGDKGASPMTRMGEAAMLRQALLDARRFAAEPQEERKGRVPTESDLDAAVLAPVAEGELPLVLHADRLDDIHTAVRLADEIGFRLIIQHGAEAGRAADMLAGKGIPVLLGPARDRFDRDETLGAPDDNAARLHRAGVTIAFQTGIGGDPAGLRREARAAVTSGLPREAALEALTIAPARIFGVADRIGSLEPGKDADIVIFDGDPLDETARVRAVIVRGRIVEGG